MVDTITEDGLKLVLSGNYESTRPDTYVFNKEKPPLECLGEPHINEKSKEFLADDMKWLASKETLLSLAMITVSKNTSDKRIITQGESGRSTVVRHGLVEFADNIGGIVIEKGGWLSGRKFLEKRGNPIDDFNGTPWGLYGSKESMNDIKFSNALIECGFKSALSLGYIPLDPDKTREWLLKKFDDNGEMKIAIDRSFSIVERNNDIPVLDFRVGGVENRIYGGVGSIPDLFVQKAFLAHAGRLMKEEFERKPERYKKYLSKPEMFNDYLSTLDKVEKRVPLNKNELFLYRDIYMAIGESNAFSLEKFLKRRKDLNISVPSKFYYYISQPKDICYAGFTYDFEETDMSEWESDDISPDEEKRIPQKYIDRWSDKINSWFDETVEHCVTGNNVPK